MRKCLTRFNMKHMEYNSTNSVNEGEIYSPVILESFFFFFVYEIFLQI